VVEDQVRQDIALIRRAIEEGGAYATACGPDMLVWGVAVALGYSAIYQGTVKLGLWRCVLETLDVANLAALEQVSAAGKADSPIGEGLADALSVGSL